jgi:hypothetical protein
MNIAVLESLLGKAETISDDKITFSFNRNLNVKMDGTDVSDTDVDECFITFFGNVWYKNSQGKSNIPVSHPKPKTVLGTVSHPKTPSDGILVLYEVVCVGEELREVQKVVLGLENSTITAIHNHWFSENPKVYYIHGEMRGNYYKIAKHVKPLWISLRKNSLTLKTLLGLDEILTEVIEKYIGS